jgi:transglutaminase superfamily protein
VVGVRLIEVRVERGDGSFAVLADALEQERRDPSMTLPGRIRRHVSRLRNSVSTPSDAWLLMRMFGWSAVLPIVKRTLPFPRLVRLMRPHKRIIQRDPRREAAITSLAAWVFKTRPPGPRDNCLERALVAYRYLSHAGAEPQLVMGVAKSIGDLHGHVWVVVDGRPVYDSPRTLESFEKMLVFGSDGAMLAHRVS